MAEEIGGSDLRRKAEELAQAGAAQTSEDLAGLSAETMQKIIFELRVHQIELELQNEELLRAQVELGKSKARFFDLYELAPVGYCTLSEQGLIQEANLTLATLLGVGRKDMVGRPLARFIHKEDQDARYLHFSHLADADSPRTTELRIVRQDGEPLWVSLETTACKDEADSPIFLVVLTDISKRKLAETAKLETESQFHDYIEYAPIGIFITDETGRYLDVNPAASRLTGYTREELLDRSIPELLTADWREKAFESFQQVIESGYSSVEVGLKRADGTRGFMSVEAVRLSPSRLLGFASDITERKEVELALVKTHQRLQLAMESAGQGIWDWDLIEGTMTWDDRMFALYGTTRGEVQGTVQDWKDGLHPEDLERTVAECEAALRGEAPFDTEFRVRHRDGTTLWIKAVALVLRDAAGVPVRMLGINQDITAHKQDVEALRASEEKFAKVFRSAPTLISLSRLEDGKLIEVNDRYCSALGFTREELLGRTTIDLGIKTPEARATLVKAAKGQGAIHGIELIMRARDGKVIPCLFFGELIEVGGETLLIEMTTDITELKRAEAERQQLHAEIEHLQKMESLGRLAGGVAHDMNNVLGAILGLASAHLESLPRDHRLYSSLETICVAATRGGDLVKRLLAFARQTPSERRELNMNALLLEEARLLERTTLAKVHLEMDLAPDLHPILGDGSALTHALMNLCVNAVDAMNEGGTLTFRTCNLGLDMIEVSVEDNGSGMTKDVLDRALDPFYTTKAIGKGTGLGLSQVFTTMKAHGGHMAIQSEPGRGTRVTMTFPATVAQAPAPGQEAPVQQEVGARAIKVLLVDDDELVQRSTLVLLEVLGHTVTPTVSGEAALALLEQGFQPDAVILDMNMPGLGGKGTLPRLRGLCPAVPVLLATGRTDQEALDLVTAHPFVTLLPKPFSFEELRERLQQVVGHGQNGQIT